MSATNAPFGLRPAYFPTGLERAQALANGIASGFAANILKGQPIVYGAAGNQTSTSTNGTVLPAVATSNTPVTGAFAGVEWTDTTGRRRVSNYWPSGTTGTNVIAYFYNDLNIVYEIQSDATIAQTSIGDTYLFSNITAGSTTTGLSAATLGVSTATANGATTGQMRVVDIAPYPDNNWGDAYVIVRVQLAKTQFFGEYASVV
jgi:hypothetical protein